MTLVAEGSMSAVAFPATSCIRTTPKSDLFEGRPLARALHVAGITVLGKRAVRRQQRKYKRQVCLERVQVLLKTPYPNAIVPRENELLALLMFGSKWETLSLENYRLLVSGELTSVETSGIRAPSIPAAAEEIIAEVRARVPGVVFEVEAFSEDPYIAAKLGSERLYIIHF